MYGMDFQEHVPEGRDNNGESHALRLSGKSFTNLVTYSGKSNILDCPNIRFGSQSRYSATYGYLIGNNYLGDLNTNGWSSADPAFWTPPTRTTDAGTNVILADANHWGTDGLKLVPHGKNGPVLQNGSSFTRTLPGVTPKDLGAEGGNVGLLDGSVTWKQIDKMKTNFASTYILYYGNW